MLKWPEWPRGLRITVIAGGSLLGLMILLWTALAIYIQLNRQTFLRQITERLNNRLNGKLTIRDMKPSLIRSFPQVSLELETVQLQDSLWQQHRHALLDAQRIFVKVNTFTLLRRRLDIREITVEDGSIYLYTNPDGYTNTNVFSAARGPEKKKKNGTSREADIGRLELRNMLLVVDNQQKRKLFRVNINSLRGSVDAIDSALNFNVRTRLQVNDFSFNTLRGSYLKDKILETTLEFNFNKVRRTLTIPAQQIDISGQPVIVGATFDFGKQPTAFAIDINAVNMPYHSATALLLPHLTRKLDSIDLQKPLDVEANIRGQMRPHDTPDIRVRWKTTNNILVTKAGAWTNCSFSGNFSNELIPGYGHHDANSAVHIYRLSAEWDGLPLKADTIQIVNLKRPELMGRFRSEFPLLKLNESSGGTFVFKDGTASANLFYKGSILGDSLSPYLDGTVEIKDGDLDYLPRNLEFRDCNATIQFSGQDMFFRNVRVKSAKSSLQMEGSMRNLLGLFYAAPEKILLDWEIRSPMIDLDEFRFFLAPRKPRSHNNNRKAAAAAASRKAHRLARQLAIVMESCNVNMRMEVDRLNYRRFDAQRIVADIGLTQTDILFRQISLSHAGGTLQLKGSVHPQGNNNRFRLHTTINNVHVDQLFYAFENFGMQSLTSRNLKGVLSARADITGNLHDNGKLAPGSMFGELTFDLRQGALVHFGPLEDIGTFFFRKRNLSYITFDNLKNTLKLQGNKILIPPMQISSSALNMDVEGVYGMPSGTDIYLAVPLRNPNKAPKKRKGIVLHLHATDENKAGKVKIKLGKK